MSTRSFLATSMAVIMGFSSIQPAVASGGNALLGSSRPTVGSPLVGAHLSLPPGFRVLEQTGGGDGTVVAALGDPTTADHIAVIIPGASWTVAQLGTEQAATWHMVSIAQNLAATASAIEPGASLAVIIWLGYDAPEVDNLSSATSDRAVAGAPALATFVDTLPTRAHVTLLAHSYGSVVAGRAAPLITHQDLDLVAIASPGMDVDSVSQLRMTARVWAMRSEDDPIVWVLNVRVGPLGHGNDPTAQSFGATRLATAAATGHTGYFALGSTALTNLAQVVLGQPEDATTQEPS